MQKWKRFLTLAMLTAAPMSTYAACTFPEAWTGGAASGDWNVTTNWNPNCVPGTGTTTDTDTAIFASISSAEFAVSLDGSGGINPGLNELIFNSSQSYSINTTAGAHFLEFNGATSLFQDQAGSHTINAPIHLNDTTLAVQVQAGTLTLLQGLEPVSSAPTSIILTGPGSLINTSATTGNVSAIINTDITILSGTLFNLNTLAQTTSGPEISATDIIVNTTGSFINTNSGSITAAGIGAFTTISANFNIAGGAVNNTNSGPVIGSTGAEISTQVLTISAGGTLTNSNTGPLGNNSNGALLSVGTSMQINGGRFTNTNSASINATGARGSVLSQGGAFTLNSGIVNNTNSGSIQGANAIGSILNTGSVIVNGGLLQNLNSGSNSGGGIGSLIRTGQFNIVGGRVLNNSFIQTNQMLIEKGGTLGGIGVYQDQAGGNTTQVRNGGKFILGSQPSGSGGQVTIQGTYQQQPTGTLVANISNPANSSQLNVIGTMGQANLAGTLQVALSKGSKFNLKQPFPIIQAQDGITGTFSNVVSLTKGFAPHLQYTGSQVLLTYVPLLPANYPGTNIIPKILVAEHNKNDVKTQCYLRDLQRRLIRYQTEFGEKKQTAPLGLRTNETGLSDLSSSFTAANESRNNPAFLAGTKTADSSSDNGTDSNSTYPQQKQQELIYRMSQASSTTPFYPGSVYFGPQGSVGQCEGSHYWMAGAQGGTDYAFVDSGIGLGSTLNYNHSAGTGYKIDEVAMNIYTTYAPVPFPYIAMNAIVGGAFTWYDYHTKTGFGPVARGRPTGNDFNALFGLEYVLCDAQIDAFPKQFQICPQISIQYDRVFSEKYTEHGAGLFDHHIGNLQTKSLRSTLGLAFFYKWIWENVTLTQEIQLGWQREFLMKNTFLRESPVAFKGFGTKAPVSGTGRNIAQGTLDFVVMFFNKYGLDVNYGFEWNRSYITHNFYLNCVINY